MVMTRAYDPKDRDEVFDTLRREILAARVKVTLDKELKRPTSETVKRLAGMKLPPVVHSRHEHRDFQADRGEVYDVAVKGVTMAPTAHQGYARH